MRHDTTSRAASVAARLAYSLHYTITSSSHLRISAPSILEVLPRSSSISLIYCLVAGDHSIPDGGSNFNRHSPRDSTACVTAIALSGGRDVVQRLFQARYRLQSLRLQRITMTISITSLPDEALSHIVSRLNDPDDLRAARLVERRFYRCVEALFWSSLFMHLSTYKLNSGRTNYQVAIPPTFLASRVKLVRAIELPFDYQHGANSLVHNICPIIYSLPNLQTLAIEIPMAQVNIDTTRLRLKSLELRDRRPSLSPQIRAQRDAPMTALKLLLTIPSLCHLEIVSVSALGTSLKNIALKDRTLSIRHLGIRDCDRSEIEGICTLIQACSALHTLHIKTGLVECSERHEISNPTLSHALAFHHNTLRTIVVTRRRCSRIEDSSHVIGGDLIGLDLTRLNALTCLSVPLIDLCHDSIEHQLPHSLEQLQVQIDSDLESTDMFDIRRSQTINFFKWLVDNKAGRLPHLRRLIWWYHAENDYIEETIDNRDLRYECSRELDLLVFHSQVPKLAQAGIELVWTETRTIEEPSFDTWPSVNAWRVIRAPHPRVESMMPASQIPRHMLA